jgi:hypothetical protein
VVGLAERPEAGTWVDAAGQLRLLLLHEGKLDLYTVAQGAARDLPPSGRRLLPRIVRAEPAALEPAAEGPAAPPAGSSPAPAGGGLVSDLGDFVAARLGHFEPPVLGGARFAVLPDRPEQPGGTMVFAWTSPEGAVGASVDGLWLSLEGRIIARVRGVPLPAGHHLLAVQPRGYDPLVLLTQDERGVGWAAAADWPQPRELGPLAPSAGLRLDAHGGLWLVQAEAGKGITARKL